MSVNDCCSYDLCFLCVFVSKCVPDIALFTSPGGPCCHKNSCIIILQQYTKLMTTGYVGQARMTQQTCTRGMLTDNGREGQAEHTGSCCKQRNIFKKKIKSYKCSNVMSKTRQERIKEKGSTARALDVSIFVIQYHPLFAHHTLHPCVLLVFMSELITGRCCQLPDQQLEDRAASQQCAFHPTELPDF